MFRLKDLKLKRWQLWLLILVALWMIYSGVTQLQREGKGFGSYNPTGTYIGLNLGEAGNEQCV
jgi:hypothetical protein